MKKKWLQLMRSFGFSDNTDALHELERAYTAAHRYYHTIEHIEHMLREYDASGEQAEHPNEIQLAIFFHDAIYDPRSSTNELDSAHWARDFLRQQEYALLGIQRVDELVN